MKIKFPKIKIENPFKVNTVKKTEGTASIFFGTGKPIKFEKDKIDQMIDLFFDKYSELRKKINEGNRESFEVNDNRFPKDRIYDFYMHMEQGTFSGNRFDVGNIVGGNFANSDDHGVVPISVPQIESTPKVSLKKPIDVLNELETVPSPVKLTDLDKNIELLKLKKKLASQLYSQYNLESAIQCLENRKKYDEYKEFFEKFPCTFSDKIHELTEKYNLVIKSSEIFVPEFPEEAILIMDAYQEMTIKLCGKKPTFYVIATIDDFKAKDKKRDPILLVQSPFGYFWNVLGAWDKEMVLLSEL